MRFFCAKAAYFKLFSKGFSHRAVTVYVENKLRLTVLTGTIQVR
jgi:hypothetical protein